MPTVSLSEIPTFELEAELRRRREPPVERLPAWTCRRCGEQVYFNGMFSPARFERQAADFESAHRNCPLSADGGGI